MRMTFGPKATDSIDYLRDAVAWANGQREDYWHPASGEAMPWATVVAVYKAVVRHLGSTIEDTIADKLPFEWNTYTKEDQAAINFVRTAFGLSQKRGAPKFY